MSDQKTTSTKKGGSGFLTAFVVVLSVAWAWSFLRGPLVEGPPASAQPLPQLSVEGWTNIGSTAETPMRETLLGQYVVIDAWATWCPPCCRAMPELAQIHAKWASQGVTFLGITPERADNVDSIKRFAQSVPGFVWPVGYGGGMLIEQLGVRQFPTLILFGPEGRSIWRGHSPRGLEAQLAARL